MLKKKVLLMLLAQVGAGVWAASRELPIYQKLSVADSPVNKLTTKTVVFGCGSDSLLESSFGDIVERPWHEFELRDLAHSLNTYQAAHGLPVVDYLPSSGAFNKANLLQAESIAKFATYSNSGLLVDTELKRRVSGIMCEWNYVVPAFLKPAATLVFDAKDRYAKNLKTPYLKPFLAQAESLDFFVNARCSIINSLSLAQYKPSDKFWMQLLDQDGYVKGFSGDDQKREAVERDFHAVLGTLLSDLGFKTHVSRQSGFGDLSFKLGVRKNMPYTLRMRNLQLSCALGASLPLGATKDLNNAASFNFGLEAPAVALRLGVDADLRHGLKAGVGFEWVLPHSDIKVRRVAIGNEPMELSPLAVRSYKKHGSTWQIDPYFLCENFRDGLDIGLGFVFISHSKDKLVDMRPQSEIERIGTFASGPSASGTQMAMREEFSSWQSNYTVFHASYDMNKKILIEYDLPKITLAYDHPWGNKSTLKYRKLALSASWLV